MTAEELSLLKTRVESDEPDALYAYACHLESVGDDEAYKFFELAAQLGHAKAAEHLGNKLFDVGDLDRAATCYRIGAKAGLIECAVKLAALNLSGGEQAAIRELEDLAESGVELACAALAEYYKSQGNRKQYEYWNSLIK
ncbi:MAG: hypothetical protein J1G38_01105 [Clostridiales bacterium]|nr:hypothetical protein [Clostridiales bacterium]